MDRSTVDIQWLSEAFGGARMGNLEIKPTDGDIIGNCGKFEYTECSTDMLTTSDSILQFLKPHIPKNKACF